MSVFKRLHKKYLESLTPEQLARRELLQKLRRDNTFYTTTTLLDDDYCKVKYGQERKEVEQEVIVGKTIILGDVPHPREEITISFGGYREYTFDRRFIKKSREHLERDSSIRFSIDAGHEIYVKNSEMLRILEESERALKFLGIELVEDSHPDFTNSEMGRMLRTMGLL